MGVLWLGELQTHKSCCLYLPVQGKELKMHVASAFLPRPDWVVNPHVSL